MLLRLIPLLVLLAVIVAVVWALTAPRRRPLDPALVVIRRVRELAWDHRDIEPTLAAALIAHIADAEDRGRVDGRTLDELLELAWQHRETDSSLSVLVVDLIRSELRDLEG